MDDAVDPVEQGGQLVEQVLASAVLLGLPLILAKLSSQSSWLERPG